MVAISPNSNDIVIYSAQSAGSGPPKFTRVWTLREHDALVTGIDWAATTNRIVSSSQDRNAYVWELHENVWKPTLVILRLQRAATSVSWSPDGAGACATGHSSRAGVALSWAALTRAHRSPAPAPAARRGQVRRGQRREARGRLLL